MSVFRRSSRLPPVSDSDDTSSAQASTTLAVPSTTSAPSPSATVSIATHSSDNLSNTASTLSTVSFDNNNKSSSRLSPVPVKQNSGGSRLSPLRIVSRSRSLRERGNSVSVSSPPPVPVQVQVSAPAASTSGDTDNTKSKKKDKDKANGDSGKSNRGSIANGIIKSAPIAASQSQSQSQAQSQVKAQTQAQTMASHDDDHTHSNNTHTTHAPAAQTAHVAIAPATTASPAPPPDAVGLGQAAQLHAQNGHRAGRHAHRESIVQRVAERLQSPHGEGKSRRRRRRRASTTSTNNSNMSRTPPVLPASASTNGIAAALARSGLQITGDEQVLKAGLQNRAVSSAGRSPYLVRQDYESDEGYGSEDESDVLTDEEIDHLPVTGFAVASNRRNAEFHALFPSVDEGDYLIEDYGCALAKDILVHGRLYVSENHICFHSNLFGWVTDVVIPFADVQEIEKKMTALVIPNAIGVYTSKERYTFASLISRDSTFDVLMNIWRIAHPDMEMTASTAPNGVEGEAASPAESAIDPDTTAKAKGLTHKATQCGCTQHYAEVALDTTFPSTPEKVYNLMFNSGWYRTFMSESQKLRDIESSDWHPGEDKKLMRTTSYIKPLNGSIGPKQTKCHIVDVHEHCDFDSYITMITTTRTPDVPSGGVFSVKTKTCFTWASASSTRVLVTTEVEWTGKSWIKGIVEKSAVDGQKQYHEDLAREMRAYMKEHASEFAVAGAEPESSGSEPAASEAGDKPSSASKPLQSTETRPRQENEYWLLQGCFDSITSGLSMIASGLGTGAKLVADMIDESRFSKTTLMFGVIGLLVLSNVYTYLNRPASQHKVKRLQRFGPSDDAVQEAVKQILARRAATTPREEVNQLVQMLDEVEARAATLRRLLLAATEGRGEEGGEGPLRIDGLD